jgi:3-hydroxybutyryl-CoA dehydrogenase
MKIATVGIIGAGQMGCGIAQVCAAAGYAVLLNDASSERISAGLTSIDLNLSRRVKSGKTTEDAKSTTLANIGAAPDLAQFSMCDLVIESATEKEAVKSKIFEALAPFLKPDCIVGSNTSSISITRLAATTGRPERQ